MTTTQSETLQMPGANLYYEVRGSGPALVMMPGGAAEIELGALDALELRRRMECAANQLGYSLTWREGSDPGSLRFLIMTVEPRTGNGG